MPDAETLCASCGKRADTPTGSHTVVYGSQTEASADSDTHRQNAEYSTIPFPPSSQQQPGSGDTDHSTVQIPAESQTYHTVPLHVVEQEDEEERRRRIAMLDPDFSAPDEEQLSNGALPLSPLADLTTHEGIPQVPESPYPNNAPQVPGAPQFRGYTASIPSQHYAPFGPQSNMSQLAASPASQFSSPRLPSATNTWLLPETPIPPSAPLTPPQYAGGSQTFTRPQGAIKWMRIGLIVGLVLVILLLSGMGISLLASEPTLSLDGSTTVAQGSILHLNGSHFLSNSTIALTLDHTTPLYTVAYQHNSTSTAKYTHMTSTWILGDRFLQTSLSGNTVKVSANGTFSVNIQVGVNWTPGDHTIQATDALNSRSATLFFTVTQQTPISSQETATSTPSEMTTPTSTTSPTTPATPVPMPTPGITPTLTPSGLSGITPGTLTLGPVNAGDQQAVSSAVVLNTTGTALLTWKASWDQQQVPWLQLAPASGQIQAPASQKVALSASPANLQAGTYKALITFTNSLNTATVTLAITLTVQASCLKVTPTSLTFVGTAGAADPSTQTLTMNNCGLAGTWNATTSANSNWLSVKPTSGTIEQKGTQTVTVAVAIASQKLAAGTYQGQVILQSGGSQVTVPVTLTVQAAAQLSVSQSKIAVAQMCQNSAGAWTCSETLSNSSTQGSLSWTSSTNGTAGVTMQPGSGTIAAGQTTSVAITIPATACAANFSLTFSGPANSISVPVDCSGTQPAT